MAEHQNQAPDLRRDKPPTQPDMRPASYLPATASAPSLTAAARPEKTKFPGWLPSFRRLDANRHPMDLQFLVQASLPAHFPARHVRSRTKFENKRLLSSPIQSQGSKKTLIHPRYLKPEAGIFFSHAIPAYSFVTLSVFSVFYNMPLYLPLYAVSFMRLSAFNPYLFHHRCSQCFADPYFYFCPALQAYARIADTVFPSVSSPA